MKRTGGKLQGEGISWYRQAWTGFGNGGPAPWTALEEPRAVQSENRLKKPLPPCQIFTSYSSTDRGPYAMCKLSEKHCVG